MWRKGETSGAGQHLIGACLDGNGDAILRRVAQIQPVIPDAHPAFTMPYRVRKSSSFQTPENPFHDPQESQWRPARDCRVGLR
ncbi:hypothetical protein ABXR19_19540 [Uliginosibacterium flavum]|uniref:Uncharacterized protein n=1 Tax=Uliginosibacterium flavum TaxID=1396831 RepID=A0ABV2TR29_9RHOO